MAAAMQTYRVNSYGAALPDIPPVLPCDERTAIDWHDFSQTLNPLGTPDSFIAAMHVISMNGANSTPAAQATLELPSLLAKRYGVQSDNIAVSSTPSDVIEAIARSYPETSVGVTMPTRASHVKCIEQAGHHVVPIVNPD